MNLLHLDTKLFNVELSGLSKIYTGKLAVFY